MPLAAELQEMPGPSNQEVGEDSQRARKVCKTEAEVNQSAEDACQVDEKHLAEGECRRRGEKLQWEEQIAKREKQGSQTGRRMPKKWVLFKQGGVIK